MAGKTKPCTRRGENKRRNPSKCPSERCFQTEASMYDSFGVFPFIMIVATMWHETEQEMNKFIRSVISVDFDADQRKQARLSGVFDDEYYEFELHVLFDDAFMKNNNVNHYVKQFINCYNSNAKHLTKNAENPAHIPTPYGAQLVITLPYGNKMVVHLKDKKIIRNKKRWSQVMFFHYARHIILESRIGSHSRAMYDDNIYILTTDGDVIFKPESVLEMLKPFKENKTVAAACCSVIPSGEGYITWPQIVEYKVIDLLEKTTEQMLGCILRASGCFVLFRASAVLQSSVLEEYSSIPFQIQDYVAFDQGEDRWLFTLLLKAGFCVKYISSVQVQQCSPETLTEFVKQRRRWINNYFCHSVNFFMSFRQLAKRDDISIFFLLYQSLVFVAGFALEPVTVFFLTLTGVNDAFGVGFGIAFVFGMAILGLFVVVCYRCRSDTQIVFVAVNTCLCLILLCFGLIAECLRMAFGETYRYDSISFYFFLCLGITALIVLTDYKEAKCIIYVPSACFMIPCLGLILPIYSLCNMNSGDWGTRATAPENLKSDEFKHAEKRKKDENSHHFMNGSVLTHDTSCKEKMLEHKDDFKTPTMDCSELCTLSTKETQFWKDVLGRYLQVPYEEEEKIKATRAKLNQFRNKMVFTFFLIFTSIVMIHIALRVYSENIRETQCRVKNNASKNSLNFHEVLFLWWFVLLLLIRLCGMVYHRIQNSVYFSFNKSIMVKPKQHTIAHN